MLCEMRAGGGGGMVLERQGDETVVAVDGKDFAIAKINRAGGVDVLMVRDEHVQIRLHADGEGRGRIRAGGKGGSRAGRGILWAREVRERRDFGQPRGGPG